MGREPEQKPWLPAYQDVRRAILQFGGGLVLLLAVLLVAGMVIESRMCGESEFGSAGNEVFEITASYSDCGSTDAGWYSIRYVDKSSLVGRGHLLECGEVFSYVSFQFLDSNQVEAAFYGDQGSDGLMNLLKKKKYTLERHWFW